MKLLSAWPAERTDRHATAVLYESPECRLVAFTLAPNQAVKVHTSTSSVLCTVVSGGGTFMGSDDSRSLLPGDTVQYAPNEPHGMVAAAHGLRFLAVITPSPSAS